MRLAEQTKIVPIIYPQDTGAGKTGDSICMKDYGHVTFIFTFGADVDGDGVLKIREGATDGATTADLTFAYAYTGADAEGAAGATLGTWSTSAALTLTEATYEKRMLVVEVDNKELTDGYDWLTVNISNAATAATTAIVAIMSQPRYAEDVPPDPLA